METSTSPTMFSFLANYLSVRCCKLYSRMAIAGELLYGGPRPTLATLHPLPEHFLRARSRLSRDGRDPKKRSSPERARASVHPPALALGLVLDWLRRDLAQARLLFDQFGLSRDFAATICGELGLESATELRMASIFSLSEPGILGRGGLLAIALGASLRQVSLCDVVVSYAAAGALARLLMVTTVRSLMIVSGGLRDDGAALLLRTAGCSSQLRQLRLVDNPITSEVRSAIGFAFGPSSKLETLEISCCPLGDKSARAIASALAGNAVMRSLALHGTLLGDGAAAALARALEVNVVLEEMDLSYGTPRPGTRPRSDPRYPSLHWPQVQRVLVVGGHLPSKSVVRHRA